MSHMVDAAKMKLVYDSILRDIMMLQNQIPLNLVRKIWRFQSTTNQIADSVKELPQDRSDRIRSYGKILKNFRTDLIRSKSSQSD